MFVLSSYFAFTFHNFFKVRCCCCVFACLFICPRKANYLCYFLTFFPPGDKLAHWKEHSNDTIYRGVKDPYQALFLFMSNFPWREDLPCAGTFIFKPNAAAINILQEWWDYDIPQKNFYDFMEQVRDGA